MGGSKKQTIGYWYTWAMCFGWCKGPIDALLEIRAGDKTAWQGRLTSSARITINKPNLWGGEDSSSGGTGGIVGDMDVMFGEADQMPNDYLISTFGPQQSGRRGKFCTAFRGGKFGAFVENPKPVSAKVERILKDWQDDVVWYPEKARISMPIDFTAPAPQQGVWRVEAGAQYTLDDQTVAFATVAEAYVATADEIGQNAIAARNAATGSSFDFAGSQYTTGLDGDPGIVAWDAAHGFNVGIAAIKATPVCPTGYDWSVVEGEDTSPSNIDAPVVMCTLSGPTLGAMNPAHVLYDSLTHADLQGEPVGAINDESFRAAADRLYEEGFGICTEYDSGQETPQQFQQRICNVIGASLSQSRVDGLYYLDLIRSADDLGSLPIIGEDDIVEFSQDPSVITETGNKLSAEWFDPVAKETRTTAPMFSMGNVRSAGRVITAETKKYPEIPVESLALRVVARDLKSTAVPLNKFSLTTRGTLRALRPGMNARLQVPSEGIGDMVVVIGSVAHGTSAKGQMKIVAVQNVYNLPSTAYVAAQEGLWTPPATEPATSPNQRAFEAPYIELAGAMSNADLAALPDDAGYLLSVATKPSAGTSYIVATAAAGEDYVSRGVGDWCPTAIIVENAGRLDTAFTLSGGELLDRVVVGSWALWDEEIVRLDAIDSDAGTIAVGRACADSVPARHFSGSRIYFCGDWVGSDAREYVGGDAVNAKLVTRTGAAQQELSAAVALPVDMAERAARPYPPANVLLDGQAYPEQLLVTGDLSVSAYHRDRTAQADQLIDQSMADIGPEAGTTYVVRNVDVVTETQTYYAGGITSWPHLVPAGNLAVTNRLEVYSTRDGLESRQRVVVEFSFGQLLLMESGDPITTEDGQPIQVE